FFQRYATMLEGLIKIIDKLVVIIGINEVIIFLGKNKAGAHVQFRKHPIMRVFNQKNLLGIKIQVFSLLITQIGVRISVAHYFAWMLHTNGSMVSSNDQLNVFLR